MDPRQIRDILKQFSELQRRQVRYRQGVVTDDSPLSVALGGSTVSYTGVAALPDTYAVGDPVAVLMFDRDLLVLGVVNGTASGGGTPGAPGSVWHFTTGAPGTGLGVVGDFALADDGSVYEKTGVATWTLRDNLTGPTGATGSTGATGATGPAGSTADDQIWLPPTGALAETLPRFFLTTTISPVPGRLSLIGGVTLTAGVTYSSATFWNSSASSALTNNWACLVRVSDREILAVSPDHSPGVAWGASVSRTFIFGAPYTPAVDEAIWVGLLVATGGSLPGIVGAPAPNATAGPIAPLWHGRSTSGLTTPLAAGTIVAVPAWTAGGPYYAHLS